MRTNAPLFTIATISYNSGKWIRQTIESVLASPYKDFEFIISDDCSTDNTWAIIQEYKDPRINANRNEKNIGEYANRNKALNNAMGKYILYVDGDDILYGEALVRLASYIQYFPEAGSFWGVPNMDIIVYPYQISPQESARLLYLSQYSFIAAVGFTETLFSVKALKTVGGFNEHFAIGDSYIKKKIACHFPTVLTSPGFGFWRLTPNQASANVSKNFRNTIENFEINSLIINDENFPLLGEERETAINNIKTSAIKLMFKNTILKGRFLSYFRLLKRSHIPFVESKRIFKKIHLENKIGASSGKPLINSYHFTNSK